MSYVITASNPSGAVAVRRDTPAEAVKKAVELIGQGMQAVLITDSDGRAFGPDDFAKLYKATRE